MSPCGQYINTLRIVVDSQFSIHVVAVTALQHTELRRATSGVRHHFFRCRQYRPLPCRWHLEIHSLRSFRGNWGHTSHGGSLVHVGGPLLLTLLATLAFRQPVCLLGRGNEILEGVLDNAIFTLESHIITTSSKFGEGIHHSKGMKNGTHSAGEMDGTHRMKANDREPPTRGN